MAQIILAPSREDFIHKAIVFLAGTTTDTSEMTDWRDVFSENLSIWPITILNPLRKDWDKTWRCEMSFQPFREQVEWELEMQERAGLVFFYFGPSTDAPISLLELGLSVRPGKAVVACHEKYKHRGNVEIVAARYDFPIFLVEEGNSPAAFADEIPPMLFD